MIRDTRPWRPTRIPEPEGNPELGVQDVKLQALARSRFDEPVRPDILDDEKAPKDLVKNAGPRLW
jgi:hypothetical protein